MGKAAAKIIEADTPARITDDHVQDRLIGEGKGKREGWTCRDGLAWLQGRKQINRDQFEAGRRLQKDYEESQMEGGAKSTMERIGGRSSYDIPDMAHAAGRRVNAALAVLPPELVSITILFLLPNFALAPLSEERIAATVKEEPKSITLAVRAGLSLLARHYGGVS